SGYRRCPVQTGCSSDPEGGFGAAEGRQGSTKLARSAARRLRISSMDMAQISQESNQAVRAARAILAGQVRHLIVQAVRAASAPSAGPMGRPAPTVAHTREA